jgi:hypothetical protein
MKTQNSFFAATKIQWDEKPDAANAMKSNEV